MRHPVSWMNLGLMAFAWAVSWGPLPAWAAQNCQSTIPATAPDERYALHDDGTATDQRTGLVWARCAVGQTWLNDTCTGNPATMTWAEALATAGQATYAGFDDWRLPNINELNSLVERRCVAPAINLTVFPATPEDSYFWSGSPANDAWGVDFSVGIANGFYSRSYDYYSVRLVRGGLSFDAFDRSASLPGALAFAKTALSVNEPDGQVDIAVSRVRGQSGPVSVTYTTQPGSAQTPQDYTSRSGVLTWADGDRADKIISIPIIDDDLVETDEGFRVILANATGGAGLGAVTATVTIVSEDVSHGALGFSGSGMTASEADGGAVVRVYRTGGSAGAVSVSYQTQSGTATAGQDFTQSVGVLTWADGDSNFKTIIVPIIDDSVYEPPEAFTVQLSNPQGGATLAQATYTLTIPESDRFIKIANSGAALPDSATLGAGPNQWACTRDIKTGLIWEVKTDDLGLRDNRWTYTWYDSNPATNGGNAGVPSGGTCQTPGRCDTEKFVQDVNAVGLCGSGDWRVPTYDELVSKLLRDIWTPEYFPHSQGTYWQSVAGRSGGSQWGYVGPTPPSAYSSGNLHVPNKLRLVRGASFGDVSLGSWAERYIHALFNAGITTGCGTGGYCPTAQVTRGQMAAFIIRALEGEPAQACASAPFGDVATSNAMCKYIKRLVELNVTTGCGNGNYCPTGTVNRQQMAAFLVRALEGEPALDYCGSTDPFNDVPHTSPMCRYIKRLAELGVTTGCGNGNYCPTGQVTREQMAAFLARAFLGM